MRKLIVLAYGFVGGVAVVMAAASVLHIAVEQTILAGMAW